MERFIERVTDAFSGKYEIDIKTIAKNNQTGYTGMVFENTGGFIKPVISLDRYYQEYENGKEMSAILNEIEDEVGAARTKRPFDPQIIFD